MTLHTSCGFLVVYKLTGNDNPTNPRYCGVDRIPEYPPVIPEEAEAVEEYVFGEYKDDSTNLIPSRSKAVELLEKFSQSPRQFEIIWCNTPSPHCHQIKPPQHASPELGFDVATLCAGYRSIVGGIPDRDWSKRHIASLNESGLFQTYIDAMAYLNDYRNHREQWHNDPYDIISVHQSA